MPTSTNFFLAALSPLHQQRLLSLSEMVDLPLNFTLSEKAAVPEFAYLLESGFASNVVRFGSSGEAEVGMVGRDGPTGSWSLLGPAQASSWCFMQVAGTGYRMPLTGLRACFLDTEAIRMRVLEFVQQQMVTAAYLTACNKLHSAEQRLARWLLMVADCVGSDTFPFTQESLAQMLGVRRMTVTLTAGNLQRSGLLQYKRGTIRILDREALKRTACECYGRIRDLNETLYRGDGVIAGGERSAGSLQ